MTEGPSHTPVCTECKSERAHAPRKVGWKRPHQTDTGAMPKPEEGPVEADKADGVC